MRCPKCGGGNVQIQTFQEQRGSKTTTKLRFKAGEKKHGCLWWAMIGWWWWMIELILWIAFFPVMFIFRLFYKKKKYTGEGSSVSRTRNQFGYTTVCVCQDCGKRWKK